VLPGHVTSPISATVYTRKALAAIQKLPNLEKTTNNTPDNNIGSSSWIFIATEFSNAC